MGKPLQEPQSNQLLSGRIGVNNKHALAKTQGVTSKGSMDDGQQSVNTGLFAMHSSRSPWKYLKTHKLTTETKKQDSPYFFIKNQN